jgi:hypothetical protein
VIGLHGIWQAKKVTVDRDNTTIVSAIPRHHPGPGQADPHADRDTTSDYDRKAAERLASWSAASR